MEILIFLAQHKIERKRKTTGRQVTIGKLYMSWLFTYEVGLEAQAEKKARRYGFCAPVPIWNKNERGNAGCSGPISMWGVCTG